MTRKEILDATEKCVCGDRDQSYGGPERSFELIAELWDPVIRRMCVTPEGSICVEPEAVAVLMILLKVARIAQNPGHMDSWVDCGGYAACGGEIASDRVTKKGADDR